MLLTAKPFWRNSTGVRRTVTGISFVPAAAVTADDTNYATLTVTKRDYNGANSATVVAQTTKITGGSGDWTIHVPVSLGTLSITALDDGEELVVGIAKAGSGVAIPAGQLVVSFGGALP